MEGKSLATQVPPRRCTWEFTRKLGASERTEPAFQKKVRAKNLSHLLNHIRQGPER